jgi:hypothetical protein
MGKSSCLDFLIKLARLPDLAVGNARGTPGGFEIVAGKRRLCGVFADHGLQSTTD